MADIISAAFFPVSDDVILSKLQALSLFTAGYIARPIGGFIIGRYGDTHGRKPALLISLSLIALTTLITACLPTYAQVGILAPIIFFAARLLQGMAFGAHAPLGWVYIAEHVHRSNLATYCSMVAGSFMMGGIASSIFFEILSNTYTQGELIDYGWRIPFILGAMFSFIALLFWHVLDETPIFLEQKNQTAHINEHPTTRSSFRRFNAIFLACILTFILSSSVIVVALMLPDLVLLRFSVDESLLMFSNDVGLLFILLGCIFYGLLADKNSTGKTMMIGSLALVISALAFYYHIANGGQYILVMYAVLGFSIGIVGLSASVLVQLFPTSQRLTAVGLTYNITYGAVGGILPFGLAYATNHISFSPALYLTFIGLVAFLIGLYLYRSPKFRALDETIK